MRFLYLCHKEIFDTKMSRVRFHSLEAIGKISELLISGPGWSGFNNINNLVNKFRPHMIIWYKPLTIPGYNKVNVPKCLRYNEMFNVSVTSREIKKSKKNLVICHHKNDIPKYSNIKDVKFVNISHCAEKTIFKDYNLPKIYDLTLVGILGTKHYLLRNRLRELIQNHLSKRWKCLVKHHPGYKKSNANSNNEAINFAKTINQSKITATCSSKYKYRLAKHVEIPMCNSLLAVDTPDEDQNWFKKFILFLSPQDSDEVIINKIENYLKNDQEREKRTQLGMKMTLERYTQEHYAKRFVKAAGQFLEERTK